MTESSVSMEFVRQLLKANDKFEQKNRLLGTCLRFKTFVRLGSCTHGIPANGRNLISQSTAYFCIPTAIGISRSCTLMA